MKKVKHFRFLWSCCFFIIFSLLFSSCTEETPSLPVENQNTAEVEQPGKAMLISDDYIPPFIINEVMSSNNKTYQDEDGDFTDWIEIYNISGEAVSLKGYGLSDREEKPLAWTFPDITLQKDQYLIIFASGKDQSIKGKPLHTKFKIDKNGESIYLWDPDGNLIDYVDVPPLKTNYTYGRDPDDIYKWNIYSKPTFLKKNDSEPYLEDTYVISFSHKSGFYKESIEVGLKKDEKAEGTSIRYTLDGSDPQIDSASYTGPLSVKKKQKDGFLSATVIRCRLFIDGLPASEIFTHTYFVDEGIDEHFKLPVVSLVSDEKNLYDYNSGIMVGGRLLDEWKKANPGKQVDGGSNANYTQRGSQWEKPVYVEFFENDGTVGFDINAGLRIHGGWSRAHPQKPMRIITRNSYDMNSPIEYELIPGLMKTVPSNEPLTTFKSFILRNGGNDYYGSMMRDVILQQLAKDKGFDTQGYRYVITYLNGEYNGLMCIREAYDENYIENRYGIDKDKVALLEGGEIPWTVSNGTWQDMKDYIAMRDFITQNDMSLEANYKKAQELIDIDNYMNYNIFQIYYANNDWPQNNTKVWRMRADKYKNNAPYGQDGKWRWMLYDTEFSFGIYEGNTQAEQDTLKRILKFDPEINNRMLASLMKNEEFKINFAKNMNDYINTCLSFENVNNVLADVKAYVEPEIKDQIKKWHNTDYNGWQYHVNKIINFAKSRTGYMRVFLMDNLDLNGVTKLSLSSNYENSGSYRINTVNVTPEKLDWDGMFFRQIPIEIEAVPKIGYAFVHWEVSGIKISANESVNPKLSLTPGDEAITLKAVYKKTQEILQE